MEIIVGSYYFPCTTSKFYDATLFDDLTSDLLNIRSRTDCPIYLLGDANAHSGRLQDIFEIDAKIAHDFGLDLLADDDSEKDIFGTIVTRERANQDTSKVNDNGKHLSGFCQASDFLILNGRAGKDRGIGNLTCFKPEEDGSFSGVSTIDYCIASNNAIGLVSDFEVDIFDKMLSDRHSPIWLTLEMTATTSSKVTEQEVEDIVSPTKSTPLPVSPTARFTQWTKEIGESFKEQLSKLDYNSLQEKCSAASNQSDLDNIYDDLQKFTLEAAIEVKACKSVTNNRTTRARKPKPKDYKPWFDDSCNSEKKMYFKQKNVSKRQGKKSVANKLTKNFMQFLTKKRILEHN